MNLVTESLYLNNQKRKKNFNKHFEVDPLCCRTIMVCADKQKVWVHVRPHRKRVWKCFDEKPQKRRGKKITKPLNVTDFVRAPGYRKKPETNLNRKESN